MTTETSRDLRRTRRALADVQHDAEGAGVARIYYAGQGIEIAGENHLLPTDADPSTLERLKETGLPLEAVRKTVTHVAKIGLIVLDACRNDPFGLRQRRWRNTGRGHREALRPCL